MGSRGGSGKGFYLAFGLGFTGRFFLFFSYFLASIAFFRSFSFSLSFRSYSLLFCFLSFFLFFAYLSFISLTVSSFESAWCTSIGSESLNISSTVLRLPPSWSSGWPSWSSGCFDCLGDLTYFDLGDFFGYGFSTGFGTDFFFVIIFLSFLGLGVLYSLSSAVMNYSVEAFYS